MDPLKLLRLVQVAAVAQAFGLTAVTWLDLVTVEWLLAFALMRGLIIAFNRPPRMTVIYNIVGRDTLSSAIALNSMIFNSSRFIGPALGGAIVALWGAGYAFLFNGLSYLAFIVVLFALRLPPVKVERRERRGIVAETLEGVRYAAGHSGIAMGLVILLLISLFARPFTELLPGIASAVFGRGVDGYSTLLAFHGVGAMAGGYWLAQRGGVRGLAMIMIVHLLVIAAALLVFATAANFWLALPLMAVTGWAFVVQGVAVQTLLQTSVDPEYRGRVMASYGIVARGAPALGALAMGGLSVYLGLMGPVAGGAALCLLLWGWAVLSRKSMARALERDPSLRRNPAREPAAGRESRA